MRRNTKHLIFSVCVAFVLCAFASVASARTIYVPDDYAKIQWAVDNASDGDMIIVRDGTYTENVDVNVDNLTLKSENGSDSTIVQASSPGDFVFEVTADRVNISGFTIKGKWEEKGVGIYIAADNCSIFNNNVSNNTCGIYLYYSSNNRITENNISNSIYGILLYSSPKNNLSSNIMENNGIFICGGCVSDFNTHVIENNIINGKPIYYCKNKEGIKIPEDAGEVILANCSRMIVENTDVSNGSVGIELAYTTKSSISNNNVNSNKDCGIILFSSSTNKISGNNVSSNGHGIYLEGSCNDNIIINNNASNNFYSIRLSCSNNNNISSNNVSNNRYGIYLWNSFKNNINNNKVSNNYKGLNLEDSSNNTVSNNDISSNNISIYLFNSPNNDIIKNNISNNNFGIYLSLRSSNNTIYLNDFSNNTKNVYYAYYSTNIWNSTKPITYTYNGSQHTNYLGNYWSDYTGSDADKDGIGDSPYIIDGNKDEYPLMKPFEHYFVPTSTPTTIYVPDDYAKIQWAVDNASDGDTIIVRDGIYYESITVDKQLTIKSEKGPENCIINGSWWLDVFTLEADGIRIEGFTITGGEHGIYILSSNNKIINNNISSNKWDGIFLYESNNNIISNNNISNNWGGIDLSYSSNNIISNNNISSNRGMA